MAVDLATLRSDVRQASDMENHTAFIPDSEVNRYINIELTKLHDLVIKSDMHEYGLSSTTITTSAGIDEYPLPSDFYRVRGVDIDIGLSRPIPIRAYNFKERYDYVYNQGWSQYETVRYRTRLGPNPGVSSIKFIPPPSASHTVTVWYYPVAPTLAADTDLFPYPDDFAEWVVLGAAIRCLRKEQNDVSELLAERQKVEQELLISAHMRNLSEPDYVTDVERDFWPVL